MSSSESPSIVVASASVGDEAETAGTALAVEAAS